MQVPALHLVHAAPDSVHLADTECVLQALATDGAAPTDRLGPAFACVAAWRYLPDDVPFDRPLEWRGAGTLTLGALFLLSAFTSIPQLGVRSPLPVLIALAGCASVAAGPGCSTTLAADECSRLIARKAAPIRTAIDTTPASTARAAGERMSDVSRSSVMGDHGPG